MKQVIVKGGQAVVEDVPAPRPGVGEILVATEASCVSIGTESSGLSSSSKPLWQRAVERPDRVVRFLRLVHEKGLAHSMDLLRGNLAAGLAVGYSGAGTVLETGDGVREFVPGDRVACAGTNYALHAEVVRVPRNLVRAVPQAVSLVDASTVALGAIALQGVRRLAPTLGETVVVFGLGLLGQITVQALRAAGCKVIAVDPDPARTALALELGAEAGFGAPSELGFADAGRLTGGVGADGVIVTAATRDPGLLNTAFGLCRRRGRVILVGDVPIEIDRAAIYRNELDFLISTSYGPGRYDSRYEEQGIDYPVGYVRWTENRNMGAYLDLLARGQVRLAPLVDVVRPVEEAPAAYAGLQQPGGRRPLGVVLTYREGEPDLSRRRDTGAAAAVAHGAARVAVIGASGFVVQTHFPSFKKLPDRFALHAIASRAGHHARHVAEQCGARYCTTEPEQVIADPEVDLVVVAGRHAEHAGLVLAALEAGKHVFVEKPLATTAADLAAVREHLERRGEGVGPLLLTGFNRRFAPAIARLHAAIAKRAGPVVMSYLMNAGAISQEHWVQGEEGGGRNIGEACHIYDLFTFLTGARAARVSALSIGREDGTMLRNENFSVSIGFEDGSLAHLLYTSLGDTAWPKERLELCCDGSLYLMDDYRSLRASAAGDALWQGAADKGHFAEVQALGEALAGGGAWPIPAWQQLQATEIALEVERQLYPHEDAAAPAHEAPA